MTLHWSDKISKDVRLGEQMIENNCQLGVIFGGKRFILLAIVDELHNDNIVHQMRCSDILQAIPAPGSSSPGAL